MRVMTNESQVRAMLEAIITEIGAGKSFGSDPLATIHNNACDRAISIVRNYRNGDGLFQMTDKDRRIWGSKRVPKGVARVKVAVAAPEVKP